MSGYVFFEDKLIHEYVAWPGANQFPLASYVYNHDGLGEWNWYKVVLNLNTGKQEDRSTRLVLPEQVPPQYRTMALLLT